MYDRLGLDNLYTTILDVQVPSLTVPVKPGRNLAVIVEVAAMNNRHKKMGYNAALEFTKQINEHFDQAMSAQAQRGFVAGTVRRALSDRDKGLRRFAGGGLVVYSSI